jgi:hypothetical protein
MVDIRCIILSESQNVMEMAMAQGDGRTEASDVAQESGPSSADIATQGLRMLERLAAGSPLAEVAAGEGLSPRRARELVAEVVAARGFDP